MITFDYDSIFNAGKYEYYTQSPQDYEALTNHILTIISAAMNGPMTQDDTMADHWYHELRKKRYHTSTKHKGKQSIMEQFSQLLLQINHPLRKRISVKQIVRLNCILEDLEKITKKHLPESDVWVTSKVRMARKVNEQGNKLTKFFDNV